MASTWLTAIATIRKELPIAQEVLNICAFFTPEGIPHSLLRSWAPDFPRKLRPLYEDRIVYNRAVSMLSRYSLLQATPEGITVHRLVQMLARQSLSPAERRRCAATAVTLAEHAFPHEVAVTEHRVARQRARRRVRGPAPPGGWAGGGDLPEPTGRRRAPGRTARVWRRRRGSHDRGVTVDGRRGKCLRSGRGRRTAGRPERRGGRYARGLPSDHCPWGHDSTQVWSVPAGEVVAGYAVDDSTVRFDVVPPAVELARDLFNPLSDVACTPELAAAWNR